MQVTETSAEGLLREFKVIVPAGDIEERLVDRLTEIGQTVTIPGFRPGKIPMPLLRQRYGEAVRGEILEKTIQDSSQQALTEKGLRPALEPKVEIVEFTEGADLEFTLAVELLPEIAPVEFNKLKLERLVVEVEDSAIDEALQRMADERKQFEAVTDGRAAETGDQVLIDFTGRIGGETFEGGAAEDFALELGANRFVPGFEEQLVGARAGAAVEVKVTFPDDYPVDDLKGKDAVFEVAVKEVRAPQPVAIDDTLASALGLADLEALRGAVRDQIGREFGEAGRARLKRKLLDQLVDLCAFELPKGMVDREFEAIWTQLKEARDRDMLDEDDKEKSDEELEARYRPIAERRVRLGLLLSEIGTKNNLQVGQDDLNRALSEQARRFPGQEAQVFEYYQRNAEAMQELQAPIFEEKVIDFVLEMVEVSERTVSLDELKALEEADEKADREALRGTGGSSAGESSAGESSES
jgi:trigger factor